MLFLRHTARAIVIAAVMFAARPGFGAPALTIIQDVLYRADGTRFSGTLYITWSNFQSGDSMIPSQGITIPVVNGAFKTQLTPTTTASAGANYNVVYSSQGKYQFTESWAVPPSTLTLRVRDVRIASGSQVGPPPPVLSQILISDVTGLATELAGRPAAGIGFQPARAAVINSSGQLDAATGNLSDCVRVDGSSGGCGSGSGGSATFIDAETPAGNVDGASLAFTVLSAPSPASSLSLYRNGLLMRSGVDFALDTNHITFVSAAPPQPGDVLVASYRVIALAGGLTSSPTPEVICGGPGAQVAPGLPPLVSTCNIPAGHIQSGDRLEVSYDFAHTGSLTGFTASVIFGQTIVAFITASAGEALATGKSSIAVSSASSQWSSQTWTGSSPYVSASAGTASDTVSSGLSIRLTGSLTGTSLDTLTLRNFTVVRFPAISAP